MKKVTHWPLTLLGSVSSLFNLFLPVLMSRRMSAEGVGDFKVFFLYLAAVPALSLGVGFTNGTYLWGASKEHAREKVRSAFLLAVIAGLAASAFSLAAALLLGWSTTLALFAFACTPMVAATIYEASLVASGNVRKAAVFSAGFEFLRLASLVGGVLAAQSVTMLFLLHGAVTWLKLLAAGRALGLISPFAPEFHFVRSALFRYALPVSCASIFELLVLNADRYVLSALLSAASFATYSFGCLMVPPLFVFEQSVNQVLIPKLARARVSSRAPSTLFRIAQEDLLLLLVPSTAGLMALAEPLVRTLFTDAYRGAAVFLEWYALYYALSAIPQDVLARARGDSTWVFRTSLSFGLAALTASFAGAKLFGAIGALQGFVLVQAARRAYGLRYFARMERTSLRNVFPIRSATVITGASVAAGIVAHAAAAQVSKPAPAFLLGAAAFVPVYFGLVYVFRPRAIARLLRFRRSK